MSIKSGIKLINSCQIGTNGIPEKDVRYLSYPYTGGTLNSLAVAKVNISFGTAMSYIPILFGNVSDSGSDASWVAIQVSFGNVSTTNATMYIYNTSSFSVSSNFKISIMAVSL